jgi:predicted nucleotidyltransferase
MQDFIHAKREQIAELCRTHHVKRLSIFGSALRDDFDPSCSDVDVIVEFETMPIEMYSDNKHALRDALEITFQRKVDLLVWEYVRNPYIRRELESSHEMLYAA